MNFSRGLLRLQRFYSSGLRGTYHRTLDRIELMLPPKLRPMYNHPDQRQFSSGRLFLNGIKCSISKKMSLKQVPNTSIVIYLSIAEGLVFAGFSDLTRPPEKLSVSQSCVLTATGVIWSRYCLVITPRIWALFAVNFFLGLSGSIQLLRIWMYNQELKKKEHEVQQS